MMMNSGVLLASMFLRISDTYLLVNTNLQAGLNLAYHTIREQLMDAATKMRSKGGKARGLLSRELLSDIGRKGGLARKASLTAEQRSEAARVAVNARWVQVRAAKKKASRKTK